MSTEFIWSEKYRPQKIADTILPDGIKAQLQSIVDSGELQHMLFTGTAGLGKTTAARAICSQIGADHIIINASEDRNIDVLRGKIKQFASTISLGGGYKVVILDEADHMNAQSTQPALRGFMDEFSKNCRFILTCNFKNKIIEPLHSRCGVFEFNTTKKEMAQMCAKFFGRLQEILDEEGVTYDKQQLAELVGKYAPDWRRTLNECQRQTREGVLDLRNLSSINTNVDELMSFLKAKDFKKMRRWVVDNIDVDSSTVYRAIYDSMYDHIDPSTIPHLVLILADYQYKDSFVADHELNTVACLTEVMSQVQFK